MRSSFFTADQFKTGHPLPFFSCWSVRASRKHAYIVLTPLNPTFISKTGVCRGIHEISYFCSKKKKKKKKKRLWVLVRTASQWRFCRIPTIYVFSRNMKNIRFFYLNFFHFLDVKFLVYLNRQVFVMSFICDVVLSMFIPVSILCGAPEEFCFALVAFPVYFGWLHISKCLFSHVAT